MKETTTHTNSEFVMKKPTWWNDSIDTSWKKISAASISAWHKVALGEKKITDQIAEEALAFGYGAREAYPKLASWSSALEDQLKTDWKQVQTNASESWDHVQAAIQHGWNNAKQAVSSAVHSS